MGLQGEQKLGKWVCGLARQGEVGWRKSREIEERVEVEEERKSRRGGGKAKEWRSLHEGCVRMAVCP